MAIVQRDHEIQTFPSHRSDQSFAERIRLRCSNWCLQDLQSKGSNGCVQFGRKRRVPIVNEEAVFVIAWYRLASLLNRPLRGWMSDHIAMQDAAGTDVHHHEDKERI
jgi:hypothetical protein